jgi:hypothetical protein
MTFNFDRSQVLTTAQRHGDNVFITRAFHPGPVRVPLSGIKFLVTNKLDDMSTRVVDFEGLTGDFTATGATIAAGHINKLYVS